jgi:hypothetical protein
MVADTKVPERVRRAVSNDLAPVRPLASPVARAVRLWPLALVVVATTPLHYRRRGDAPARGWGALVDARRGCAC